MKNGYAAHSLQCSPFYSPALLPSILGLLSSNYYHNINEDLKLRNLYGSEISEYPIGVSLSGYNLSLLLLWSD